jgi:DNA-binding protein YbaB
MPEQSPTLPELIEAGRAFEQRMRAAQADLARAVVTGRSADGTVAVLASGLGQLKAVQVDPAVYEQRAPAALQDAIAEAIRAAAANASALAQRQMGAVEINLY